MLHVPLWAAHNSILLWRMMRAWNLSGRRWACGVISAETASFEGPLVPLD